MVHTHVQIIREHIRLFADGLDRALDGDLLRRHIAGDSDAFVALVRRHGPMVYGACRRVLGQSADAEDAFQATFLALARNSAGVRNANALSAWLHRVALRTANKALARRKHLLPVDDGIACRDTGPAEQAAWADVRRALDEELNRLPEHLRSPLVLCYLDGATRDEAARRLGWSVGTFDRRLATGRAILRARLTRRGLGAVALSAAVFAEGLHAAVPVGLANATSALATSTATVPAVLQSLISSGTMKLFHLAASVVLFAGVTIALVAAASRTSTDEPGRPEPPARVVDKPVVDALGDALPDGAILRIGSTRFRHPGISDFALLPDGKSIASIGFDRSVRFWELETGRRTRVVELENASGRLFTISADGKYSAGCSKDKLTVWDTESGKVLTTLAGPKTDPSQLGFSDDGTMLAVGGGDCRFSVWEWKAGKEHAVPVPLRQSGQDSTFHCHFSRDGKYFAAGVWAFEPLCVFDTATWKEVLRTSCSAATSAFSPDGKQLIVSSMKNDQGARETVFRVFDLMTGKEVAQFPQGHEFTCFSVAVSPDGRLLGCGASDKSCLFDLSKGKVLYKLNGRPWGLAFTPDGRTFVASADGTHLRFWDVASGKERMEQSANFGGELATAVSPDGRLLAVADWMDRAVQIWDTATGQRVSRCPHKEDTRYTRNLTFSTDGRTISAGMYQGATQAWDVATGKPVRDMQLGVKPAPGARSMVYYYSAHIAANQPQAATLERTFDGKESTRLTIWDMGNGKAIRERVFPGERRQAAWSSDGETLALAVDNAVHLIELDTCNDRAQLAGATAGAPVISSDGRLVAVQQVGDKPNAPSVGVYEVATGKAVARVATGTVAQIALAGDNCTLIATSQSHLQAWDLATGKRIYQKALPNPGTDGWGRMPVTRLEPLRSGQLFTALSDGTALVWELSSAPIAKTADTQLADRWTDLLSDDSSRAYSAIWRMSEAAPDAAVTFLRPHLQPEPPTDPAKLRQLIGDLNSDTFRVREKATKDLQNLGHRAVPALRKALEGKPPAEAMRRIEQILSRKPDVGNRPEQLRRLRAMQVLERIGSKEARALFAELAEGLPQAAETKDAKAALGGLANL